MSPIDPQLSHPTCACSLRNSSPSPALDAYGAAPHRHTHAQTVNSTRTFGIELEEKRATADRDFGAYTTTNMEITMNCVSFYIIMRANTAPLSFKTSAK